MVNLVLFYTIDLLNKFVLLKFTRPSPSEMEFASPNLECDLSQKLLEKRKPSCVKARGISPAA